MGLSTEDGDKATPPLAKRAFEAAIIACGTTAAGVVVKWVVPERAPDWLRDLANRPELWVPFLVVTAAVAIVLRTQSAWAERYWWALSLAVVASLVPGFVVWAREDATAGGRMAVDVGVRRLSGRDGPQRHYSRGVRVRPGDRVGIRVRVSVLDDLPADDASVRLAIAKAPVRRAPTGGILDYERGVRADVLEHAGEFGAGASAAIEPAGGAVRIVPEGRIDQVVLTIRTEDAMGAAPPWRQARTVSVRFHESLDDYGTNLGRQDALDHISKPYTDEVIEFRVRIEAG